MIYTYSAVDKIGVTKTGEVEADSEKLLAENLKKEGLFLLEAKEKRIVRRDVFSFSSVMARIRPVTIVDRMMLARNLAVMIGAGLPLARALFALGEQADSVKLKTIIIDLRQSIVKGETLADALVRHEDVFGSLFVNMVGAGEASGKLEYVLKLLARQMKRDHDLISKVRGALIYPSIIICTLLLIGGVMMVYVVPILTQTFKELEIDLPFTTQIIIGTSNFLLKYYLLVLGMIPVAVYATITFLKTERGKVLWGAVSLRIPVLGALIKKVNSARFSRILASLISSGIPIVKSLEITSKVIGNYHFKTSLNKASLEIQKGTTLSNILKEYPDLYPVLVTQMLEVGEETGTTSRMLLRLALFYESEVSNTTKNLSSIIEPVLMVVIGGMVGFFAVSMVQPIYSGIGGL